MLFPTNFSGPAYVVAPYWADADARLGGEILYEIFYRECNTTSNRLLDRVGTFITNETGVMFTGWVEMITMQILVKNVPYTLHCRKHNPITCSCNSKKLLKNFRTLSLSGLLVVQYLWPLLGIWLQNILSLVPRLSPRANEKTC